MPDSNEPEKPAIAAPAAPVNGATPKRGPALLIAGGVILVLGLGFGIWHLIDGGRHVETENAYVDTRTGVVSALVAAPVIKVNVNETQVVKTGDVLVELDATDLKLARDEAKAQLDVALSRVNGYFENDSALKAQADAANANIESARATLNRARKAYDDRKALKDTGAVSGEDFDDAQQALSQADAAYKAAVAQGAAAISQRAANATLINKKAADQNPEVIAARSKYEQTETDLERTLIRAPVSGIVAKSSVNVGQRTTPGAPLMSVIAIDQAYVNANFKEGQLTKVRVGQKVELTADAYGKGVKYEGHVEGLSGGTGSAFSLIPAQNATGNWIKVVQRLPVRIAIDSKNMLKEHPLRVGMTMSAKIDVSK